MRFRPPGGISAPKAQQARAEALAAEEGPEQVFDSRYTKEIEQAENIAAGLPPDTIPPEKQPDTEAYKKANS